MSDDATVKNLMTHRPFLARWADAVRRSEDWRRFLIGLVSGAVSVFAMAPFFFWPVLFVTIPNLVWLIDGATDRQSLRPRVGAAALNGWVFGFGYFSAGLFWVGEAFLAQATEFVWLLPFAVTLLPAGLALFFAAAAGFACAFWHPGISRLLVLAASLSVAEWLRGHVLTGFPWNTLGYAFTAPIELMQVSSVIGVYSLTFWVVLLAALPAIVAADGLRRGTGLWTTAAGALTACAVLASAWAFGAMRLHHAQLETVPDVRVRIVQPSIPQWEKWQPGNRADIFAKHLALSGTSPSGKLDNMDRITHVVWPEVALPFLPLEVPEALRRIAERLPAGVFLITGGLRREQAASVASRADNNGGSSTEQRAVKHNAYNSMLVFDDAGRTAFIYDKIHLVPFGEYLPFQETLESIGLRQLTQMRGGFTSGIVPRPQFDVGELKSVAGLICYEVIFPGAVLSQSGSAKRPSVFINLTNDGWFGNTTGPRQHFHQARVRAVETGIPIIRAANNGISAAIGPAGRIVAKLPLNAIGTIDSAVPKVLAAPLYARYGDALFFLHMLCFFGTAWFLTKNWKA